MTVANPLGGLFMPQWPRLIAAAHPSGYAGALTTVLNTIFAARVISPAAGTLRDLNLYFTTASGNVIGGIYDTGDASPGNRTKLFDSGTIAVGGTGWLPLGAPSITVQQGQELDFAFIADNAIAVVLRMSGAATSQQQLPTNFLPVGGGALPKLAWTNAPGSFSLPATIPEAGCAFGSNPLIIARVA